MSDNSKKEFARTLQALMDEAEMRATDLAAASGLNKSVICYYLQGINTPGRRNAEKLAAALGVPLDALAASLGGLRALYNLPEGKGRRKAVKAGGSDAGVPAGVAAPVGAASGRLPTFCSTPPPESRAGRADEDTGASDGLPAAAALSAGLPSIPLVGRVTLGKTARVLGMCQKRLKAAINAGLVPFAVPSPPAVPGGKCHPHISAAGLRAYMLGTSRGYTIHSNKGGSIV